MSKIQLGDEVKDSITGFKGTAVARTQWLHGCTRITIQPKGVDKDGKPFENATFDEPQCVLIAVKKVARETKTGGPMLSTPQKKSVATRN